MVDIFILPHCCSWEKLTTVCSSHSPQLWCWGCASTFPFWGKTKKKKKWQGLCKTKRTECQNGKLLSLWHFINEAERDTDRAKVWSNFKSRLYIFMTFVWDENVLSLCLGSCCVEPFFIHWELHVQLAFQVQGVCLLLKKTKQNRNWYILAARKSNVGMRWGGGTFVKKVK